MKHRCCLCNKLTTKYQRINGGAWHCYDGCYSTTGSDYRTEDGTPLKNERISKGQDLLAC